MGESGQGATETSGREHETARFNVKKRDVWAVQPNNWLSCRYPSRSCWTLVRGIRRWYWIASDQKYDDAKQVSGQTRSDPDWYTPVSEETNHSTGVQ